MADSIKAQKLAAARKRLKQYQQKNQATTKKSDKNDDLQQPNQISSSGNVTPVDSIVSSTHSAYDTQDISYNNNNQEINNSSPSPQIQFENNTNYFNTALFQPADNHLLSNYFDTIQENNRDNVDNAFINNQNKLFADPFENSTPLTISTSSDVIADLSANDVTEEVLISELPERHKSEIADSPFDVTMDLSPNIVTPAYDVTSTTCANSEIILPEQSECVFTDGTNNNQKYYSNTESLRQLSSQINHLIDQNKPTTINNSSELEQRNLELAALLENERLKTEQFNLQLREYITRITQLETETQHVRNEHDAKLSLALGPVQEQLQYHVQTVGILVGEKTELTMALNQSQSYAKQKTSECEELQTRLKASKHRVSDLEKTVNELKSSKHNLDKSDRDQSREFETLKINYNLLLEQTDELKEESSELREKLNVKTTECHSLHQELQDKNSHLSLSQLKLQQLTSGDLQSESQLEVLNQHKLSLETQITELTQTIKVITSERDQASQQYQQYVQQLNAQVQNLAEKLEVQSTENEALSKREQSLVKHIGDLEKHLQQLITEKQVQASKVDLGPNLVDLQASLSVAQNEKLALETNYSEVVAQRTKLEEELEVKTEMIQNLEAQIEKFGDQPDAVKLLATMESDKVAASRAVEQNKKLKEQLEELHDGFIKMSNSKLELTEKLQSVEYQCRDLSEKLSRSQTMVEHLHTVISTKDKELLEQQSEAMELQKQILHQHQLTDRLRHYEAQGTTSDYVQQELQNARQIIVKLEQEKLQSKPSETENDITDNDENNYVKTLKSTITQLEMDKEVMQKKFHEFTENNRNENDTSEYLDKENAMLKLEERFKNTIQEVANLTEEKQKLEHLVMQLQSETETIGEYVALYQCQRAKLKETTLEKDEQLERLEEDRADMKVKLDELNALIQNLLPKELIHNIHGACEDHADNVAELKTQKPVSNDNNNENYGTAGKIIALLSEIKTSNLVQPGDNIQNFHPCPWCSGQLITV